MIHLQATGQHENKAGLTHSPVYYPFASTHMVNTQLLRVQNVHTKYCKLFRGFFNSSRLLNFARNSRKLMHRDISTFTVFEGKSWLFMNAFCTVFISIN